MSEYEKAARAAGFTVRAFGKTAKIARNESDGKYPVSENGWRYACEDAGIAMIALELAPARFTLSPCKNVNFDVEIQPAEFLLGHEWDTVLLNGLNVGNRHGGIDNFTRRVLEANPTIILD